jgi:hypothetical protein
VRLEQHLQVRLEQHLQVHHRDQRHQEVIIKAINECHLLHYNADSSLSLTFLQSVADLAKVKLANLSSLQRITTKLAAAINASLL